MKMIMPILRAFLALLLGASIGWGAELQTLAGKTVSGDLVSITDKEVVFRSAAGQTAFPILEVLKIEVQPAAALPGDLKYTKVELTDGTVLHCTGFTLKGKEVELKLAISDQVHKIPLAAVAYVMYDAQDAATRQKWQEQIFARKNNTDILVIKSNGVINTFLGTLGEGNDKGEINFVLENGSARNLPLTKIHGLFFLRTLGAEAPAPLCKVYDVNQNILAAGKLTLNGDALSVTTLAGAKVELPLKVLARLDYTSDKLAYLSDLKPVEVVQRTKQGRKDGWRVDKNLENTPLQIAGQVYAKGLALHAYTELVYNLDGKYKEFKFVPGVDDTVGGDGQPVLRIEGDGNKLFEETITRKTKKEDRLVVIKGVRQLRIIVSSNGLFDFGDHLDLADAKLNK
jgi:hypothetical protein